MPHRALNFDTLGKHFPLGDSITGSPHSVAVSLPTMRDIVGYEEKDPAVLGALQSGYPRFVIHPLIREWRQAVWRDLGWGERAGFGLADARAVAEWRSFVGEVAHGADTAEVEGAHWVALPRGASPDVVRRARAYLTHTGAGLSSRQAEDGLVGRGLAERFPEARFEGSAAVADSKVRNYLADLYGAHPDDLYLCRGGMNAFYAGFRALRLAAAREGRDLWIQLGWLYVDTTRLLEEYSPRYQQPEVVLRVDNLEQLETLMRERGRRVAGIVTEAPTNPRIQTCNLPYLRALADQYGAALVLDPSVASPHNVQVYPYADVHLNSLTKYAAPDADVMAGVLALNPTSRYYDQLRSLVGQFLSRPYEADLQRLALEIDRYAETVDQVNANTRTIATWLERHPDVRTVEWAEQPSCLDMYRQVARHPLAGPGALISFTLRTPMEAFYDRVALPKTPSFGARFTMLCPFIHLAHYDLVHEPGQRRLQQAGLVADLVRLSVGTEDVEAIIEQLRLGLAARK